MCISRFLWLLEHLLWCSTLLFQAETAAVKDVLQDKIVDLYLNRHWGLKFATTAANTVLNVDQVGNGEGFLGPLLLQRSDAVASLSANSSAAFKESCAPIG